ncbi:hypothetical protein SAY86_000264 [Trapa natans]|uniref:Leucine-rich repeat-containing N-terminal plant-type domain-containing protein n=1 Tax=Trapa natans TaxID=22666 RepID=A0AAN7MER1_TRANT|nr:hypothetical protein SAY86_000264 [Trapa natans]
MRSIGPLHFTEFHFHSHRHSIPSQTMAACSSSILLFLLFGLLTIRSHKSVRALTSPSDIAALMAFKSAVKPSSIPSWSCLASWNFSSADPCSSPRRTFFTCGFSCSSSDPSRIIQLTLDPAGYSGTLSPLISDLSMLTNLDLADNSFYGPIPPSISSLSELRTLTLRSNSFSDSIPPSVTSLRSLESIDLSHNSLSGPLPKSMDSLTNLKRLDLSFNQLSGSIPKLPPNLLELALKGNSLSGSLEKSSFDGLTQLEVVELSQNSLSGAIEPWLFLLPSVQQVDLANNTLTRLDIEKPSAGSDNNLVAVDLGFNSIEGNIPVNLASYPGLSSLSLRYNQLRGVIPAEFSQVQPLRRLYLDGNFLSGKPPAAFFTSETALSGSIGYNCLEECPASSQLCVPSQKPVAICRTS